MDSTRVCKEIGINSKWKLIYLKNAYIFEQGEFLTLKVIERGNDTKCRNSS